MWQDIRNFHGVEMKNASSEIFLQISIDSRKLKKGETFLALRGTNYDGHKFVTNAIRAGAAGVIVERKWFDDCVKNLSTPIIIVENTKQFLQNLAQWQLQNVNPITIGITGTNGKTTVKNLLSSFLSTIAPTHFTLGNYNNSIGLPLSLLNLSRSHRFSVLEMGASEVGEIDFLANLTKPKYGIITNIGIAHLEGFGDEKFIAREKSALFAHLPEDGIAFVNADDHFISQFETKAKSVTFSFKNKSENQAKITATDSLSCIEFNLNGSRFKMPVPGIGFAKSALASIIVAQHFGVSSEKIIEQLENFKTEHGRMEKFEKDGITIIDDSYNANPSSVKNSIRAVGEMDCSGKRIFVFGDMLELGKLAKKYHAIVADWAVNNKFSCLFTYGELSRNANDSASAINIHEHFETHESLLARLQSVLEIGDIVLVKGSRGMELEKIVEGLIEA